MLHAQPSIRLPSYLTFSVGKSFLDKTENSGIFFGCLFFLSPSSDFNYYVRFALLQSAVLSSQRTRREPNSKVRDKSETKKKKGKKKEKSYYIDVI